MRKACCLMLVVLIMATLFGCSSNTTPTESDISDVSPTKEVATSSVEPTESGEKILIGYSPKTLVNEWWSVMGDAIRESVEAAGGELVAFDPQSDATVQATQVNDMISMGIKALLIVPVDSQGCRTIMQSCKDAGVYVVNIDNVISEADYDVCDAIVASDNYSLGYISGEDVVKRYPDGANIAVVHTPISESCIIAVNAFWDAIKENAEDPSKYVELTVQAGNGDTQQSFSVAVDILQAFDDITAFFCVDDPTAMGVIQAIEDAGLTGTIGVYGKDASPDGKKAIVAGKMVHDAGQSPITIGKTGVERAFQLIAGKVSGKDFDFNTPIPAFSVTIENVEKYGVDGWQ